MSPFQPSRRQPASRSHPRSTEPKEIEGSRAFSDSGGLVPFAGPHPALRHCFYLLFSGFRADFVTIDGAMLNTFTVASGCCPQARGSKPPLYSDILMQCRLCSLSCFFPPRQRAPQGIQGKESPRESFKLPQPPRPRSHRPSPGQGNAAPPAGPTSLPGSPGAQCRYGRRNGSAPAPYLVRRVRQDRP